MKLKYPIALLFIILTVVFFSRQENKSQPAPEIESSEISSVKGKNLPAKDTLEPKIEISTKSNEVTPKPVLPNNTQRSQQEITKETLQEFIAMKIPSSFPSNQEARYQQIYQVYLKTSFYLSEVAAGHIEANQANLVKAFKGLSLFFNEVGPQEQGDDALVIISNEWPALFEEALNELSKKDRAIIQQIMVLQSATE